MARKFAELEARMTPAARAEADRRSERLWHEALSERLAADAAEAAEYLRATVEEHDAQLLAQAVRNVQTARGSLNGLPLGAEEWRAMVTLLSEQAQPFAQAA